MGFPFLFKSVDPTATVAVPDDEPPPYNEHSSEELAISGGLNSDRLFFDPDAGESSSILFHEPPEKTVDFDFPYKETTAIIEVDSRDPLHDFKVSMEEMVSAHGIKDWESLEELLSCYLRVNVESNHAYIIKAFVEIWIRIGSSSGSASPLSFSSSSPCLSSSLEQQRGEIVLEKSESSSCSSV